MSYSTAYRNAWFSKKCEIEQHHSASGNSMDAIERAWWRNYNIMNIVIRQAALLFCDNINLLQHKTQPL